MLMLHVARNLRQSECSPKYAENRTYQALEINVSVCQILQPTPVPSTPLKQQHYWNKTTSIMRQSNAQQLLHAGVYVSVFVKGGGGGGWGRGRVVLHPVLKIYVETGIKTANI